VHLSTSSDRRRSGRLRAAVVTGAFMAASLLAACGSSDDGGSTDGGGGDNGGGAVKIGVLAPITGELAPYGEALERGMTVAAELINEDGGIGGKKVEWVLEDDQTDPKAASTAARKLLTQERVDFLMGTTSSATTLAVIPQAERAKVPFFYVVEGESKTCDSSGTGTREYIFGNGETPEQKMTEYVPWMLENLGKRVYLIGSDYVFPHFVNDLTSKLIEENGGTVVGTAYAPLGTSDFSSYISEIERAKPDVIFISVVGTDGIALVKQLNQFGLRDKVELTGIPTFAGEVLPGIADVAQDVYTVERYWDKADNPVNEKFAAAYHAKYGDEAPIGTIAAQGAYGTLLLLQAAAEKAGTTDREAVAKALPGVTVESPAGEITVNPDNNVVTGPIRLLQVKGDNYDEVQDLGQVPHPGHSGCSSQDV
jgi:ABC-type branched-subunit amino acid transport system substrate-binding protein